MKMSIRTPSPIRCTAPGLADAGIVVDPQRIAACFEAIACRCRAGRRQGLAAGCAARRRADAGDLVRLLKLQVVLVVDCASAASTTPCSACAQSGRWLQVDRWIGNAVDPGMAPQQQHTLPLQARIQAPLLSVVQHGVDGTVRRRHRLAIEPLLAAMPCFVDRE
ncbi:MAG: hypothetical protein R3F08_00350 [Dokdonella sp.]